MKKPLWRQKSSRHTRETIPAVIVSRTMMNTQIKEWLNDRCISDDIITRYALSWNGSQIVIPIFDERGEFVSEKRRRSPFENDGPKYTNGIGSKARLFGFPPKTTRKENQPVWTDTVILCEGELDALALMSMGCSYTVVSSTNGSKSFNPAWIPDTVKHVYIVYDNDNAGIDGALLVNSVLPRSSIVTLHGVGKDVTDYFVNGKTLLDFYEELTKDFMFTYPSISIDLTDKKALRKIISQESEQVDMYLNIIRDVKRNYGDIRYLEKVKDMWMNAYTTHKKALEYVKIDRKEYTSKLEQAKAVPIPRIIELNQQGFAPCVFHKEKTPSMKYYKRTNDVHCFGCGKHGDTVDIVMAKTGCTFIEAIDYLLSL